MYYAWGRWRYPGINSTGIARTRKLKINQSQWKKVKQSCAYNTGAEVKSTGVVLERKMGLKCWCKRTMYHCRSVTDDQRLAVFHSFWQGFSSSILR